MHKHKYFFNKSSEMFSYFTFFPFCFIQNTIILNNLFFWPTLICQSGFWTLGRASLLILEFISYRAPFYDNVLGSYLQITTAVNV